MPFYFVPSQDTLFLRTRAYDDRNGRHHEARNHNVIVDDRTRRSRLYIPMGDVYPDEASFEAREQPLGYSVWEDPEA